MKKRKDYKSDLYSDRFHLTSFLYGAVCVAIPLLLLILTLIYC